ncbi:MAG: hypothetical protein C4334_12795 [Pyrinomonas sp.]
MEMAVDGRAHIVCTYRSVSERSSKPSSNARSFEAIPKRRIAREIFWLRPQARARFVVRAKV